MFSIKTLMFSLAKFFSTDMTWTRLVFLKTCGGLKVAGSWTVEVPLSVVPELAEARLSRERAAEKTARVFMLKTMLRKHASTRPVAVGRKRDGERFGGMVDGVFAKWSSNHHLFVNIIAVLSQLPSKKLTLL